MERKCKNRSKAIVIMLQCIPVAPQTIKKSVIAEKLGRKSIEALLLALPSWLPLGADDGQLCYISEEAKERVMTAYSID